MLYLNNAATTYPKPRKVIEAVHKYIEEIPFNSKRTGYDFVEEDIEFSCRKKLAYLFNIDNPNTISFTSGATEALNHVINGLDLQGAHVISTVLEHNSVLRPLKRLEHKRKIELSIVETDINGFIDVNKVREKIRLNTKALIVNHCSNVLGTIQNIEELSKIAHKNNIVFIVDASQSAGSLDINVKENNIDVLIFTGHKSLFGLTGIGGIYIRENLDIEPLKVGGTGIRSDLLFQPNERPIYYEAGTKNITGIVSLEAGVSFILDVGIDKIKIHKTNLFCKLNDYLKNNPNIILYGSEELKNREPIITFNIKGYSPSDAGYIMENSFKIVVRTGLHCAPLIHKCIGTFPEGSIRISPSYFTKEKDIDYFMNSIEEMCKAK